LDITKQLATELPVPVIASGGGGNMQHFEDVFRKAKADAALAASIFHFKEIDIQDLKDYLSEKNIPALAKSGTVAVLLPGAFYFLREKQLPPIAALRKHHVPMAISTDCNPGTSPVTSLLLIMNMACTLFSFTPEEALAGVTCHAAKALGLQATHGTLTVGKVADFAIWDVQHPAELSYYLGANLLHGTVRHGKTALNPHYNIKRS